LVDFDSAVDVAGGLFAVAELDVVYVDVCGEPFWGRVDGELPVGGIIGLNREDDDLAEGAAGGGADGEVGEVPGCVGCGEEPECLVGGVALVPDEVYWFGSGVDRDGDRGPPVRVEFTG